MDGTKQTELIDDINKDSTLKSFVESFNSDNNEKSEEVLIFISFDLVDSTKFKNESKYKTIWPNVIMSLYELLINSMLKINGHFKIWKYLGDEILFFIPLDKIKSLHKLPKDIFEIQIEVPVLLKETFKNLIDLIQLKTTIWTADISYISKDALNPNALKNKNKYIKNIGIALPSSIDEILINDFVGTDMDEGFRIAKYACHHKIIFSCAFAYLLLKTEVSADDSILPNIKIVSLKILKGIWNGKHYPIIWYTPNWDKYNDEYIYSEHLTNEMLLNAKENKTEEITFLTKILTNTPYLNEYNKFVKKCKNKALICN